MRLKLEILIDGDFNITSVDELSKDQISEIERQAFAYFCNGGISREMLKVVT